MGIMTRTLKSLFPKAFKFTGDLKAVVEALGEYLRGCPGILLRRDS